MFPSSITFLKKIGDTDFRIFTCIEIETSVVLQNRFVGYFAMVKNTYNLTLPPIKKLTIKKIVIYSIHGKCSMYNWRNGQEGQCSYYLGGFSHRYIHRQSQLIAVSGASGTGSSPWNCPLALYCYGHLVAIVQLLSHV